MNIELFNYYASILEPYVYTKFYQALPKDGVFYSANQDLIFILFFMLYVFVDLKINLKLVLAIDAKDLQVLPIELYSKNSIIKNYLLKKE